MGGAYELAFSIYMYMNPYKGKMLYIYTETLHFVLKCNFFNDQRTRYIKPYYRNRPNVCKMSELLNHPDQTVLQNLTSFVEIIMKSV